MTRPLPFVLAVAALVVAALAMAASAAGQSTRSDANANCAPLDKRQANAESQRPAFEAQTRACAAAASPVFDVAVLARGLEHPWAVEPLPDGDLLVTEKAGRMRIVAANGDVGPPIAGVPAVDYRSQGGLLDAALSPNFATDRTIFWSYAEPREGGNGTSVARGVLSADRRSFSDVRVILRAQPTHAGALHFGSRLAFDRDGLLYVTLGERSDIAIRPQAQQLSSHMGKILRVTPDGQAPRDNPFVGQADARPEIWTLGHRNVQAAAFDARGRLWVGEMGARGGDELNLVEKGKNYGWPAIAYGEEYSGRPIGAGATARPGLEQPVYYWDPVIAPSGAEWYSGEAFPAWRGNLFVGGLRERALVRLVIEGDRVVGEERLLVDRGQRIRDVRQGADGALYVVTDERNGELLKITPRR